MKFFRNKKIVAAVLLVLLVVLALTFSQIGIANAKNGSELDEYANIDTTGIAAPPTVDKAKDSGSVLLFLGNIASAILTLLAGMIEWAVELGQQVIGLDVVKIGAGQVLAFANLGFVLAIIIIAFATIFRVQSYAMKQTLWKLIAAALLVNFSLTIAGAFISVSDVLTTSFLSQIKGGIGSGLAGIVKPQTLPQTDSGVSGSIFSLEYWLKYLVSIFFVVIFSFILVLIFAFIFIMFLIRDVALALLLIVMPIVWLAWIFPGTVQHWRKWWGEFMRWLFFGPIALFFIALIVNTGNQLNSLSANIVSQGTIDKVGQAFERNKFLEPGFFAHVGQMFIVGGLLIAGVMMANKLGLFGSKAVYGGVQNIGKSFGGWVGRRSISLGTAIGGQRVKNKLDQWQQGLSEGKYKGIGKFSRSALSRPLIWAQQKGGNLVDQMKGKYKDFNNDQLALAYASASREGKVAIAEMLGEKGKLNKLPDGGIDMASYKKFGRDPSKLTKVNTLLDNGVQKAIESNKAKEITNAMVAAFKKFKPNDFSKMQIMDMVNGKHSGLSREEWDKKGFDKAALKAIVNKEAVTADEFSKAVKNLERSDRNELVKKINLTIKDKDLERDNPSVHKYIKKGMGQEIFLGGREEGEEGEKGKEGETMKAGTKEKTP